MALLLGFFILQIFIQVSVGYRTRCHPINREKLSFCLSLEGGYATQIMLPTRQGHQTQREIGSVLSQWSPLLASHCHPHLKRFLCSVYAPVCFANPQQDSSMYSQPPITTVSPCRSWCISVQTNCEPFMKKHGNYSWPDNLNCNQFTEGLCISASPAPKAKPSSIICPPKFDPVAARKKYCEGIRGGNFVFRARLADVPSIRAKTMIIKFRDIKPLKGRLPTAKGGRSMLLRARLLSAYKTQCKSIVASDSKILKRNKFVLVIGNKKPGNKRFTISYMVRFSNKKRKLIKRWSC